MRNKSVFVRQRTYFAILKLLDSITAHNKYPDFLIGELFKKEKFESPEKAIIASFVYGILRHRGRIDHIIENTSRASLSNINLNILNILRICTYQAVFTETSPSGIINNAVALSANEDKFRGFVKRIIESVIRNKDTVVFPDKIKNPLEHICKYHSHPVWIVEKWKRELNDWKDVEALCNANNVEPPLTIRVNPLKISRGSLQSLLEDSGYPSIPTFFSPFGLIIEKKEDIFKTEEFKNGTFEVQDEGSQLITMLTGAKSGELVIDACAGNGGKSLFLSGLMENHGSVIALETNSAKLLNLKRRAARAGALNIRTSVDDFSQYKDLADCVLIDAPCSGMGVFRRNPDSKWRLTQADITELSAKQREIFRDYCQLVKPRGRLVYATCTISKEENEEIVYEFLEENKDFHVISPSEICPDIFKEFIKDDRLFRSLPHVHDTDGFFGVVMRRKHAGKG